MSVSKRVAYLKGLAEGLELDGSTKEGKLLSVMIDILEDVALVLEEVEEDIKSIDEEIDTIDGDLRDLEDAFLDEMDDDEAMEDVAEGDEPVFYEIKCPTCGHEITIDEDVLLAGSIKCPNCSEELEFDMEDLDEPEEKDGCCDHSHGEEV